MPPAPCPLRLVLWDVDHTLIETRGVGQELYRRAFKVATGRAVEHDVEVTGRTETAIFAEALRLHGLASSAELEQRYAEALAWEYEHAIHELQQRGRGLPGARQALVRLSEEPAIRQSVLTGNLKAVAKTKLRAFGMEAFINFEIGAYGDDHADRPPLVAIAQRRATERYGEVFDRTNTVLVGDTAGDIEAAHQGGAAVVAVASGKETAEQLRVAGAEAVLADLAKTEEVVRAVVRASVHR